MIGDHFPKETGEVSAFFKSKIGLVYSRSGFGNYFSFLAFLYSRIEIAHVFLKNGFYVSICFDF